MSKKKMLSPKQYAEKIGKPYTTVMTWLQGELIPEAVKHRTPTGHYWEIPDGTKPPALKPGPKPRASKNGKPKADGAGKKKR